jgi:opacity protein-like surface antigen
MGLNLAWSRKWTERYSSSLSIFYSNFESSRNSTIDGIETTSDSIGINISSTYLLSEKWEIFGTIGGRVTESDTDFITILGKNSIKNRTEAGFLLDAGFNYNGESLSALFNVNRSLVPSSQGQLNEQSRISLDLDYQITERLSFGMLTSYQESESASIDNGQTESIALNDQLNNRKNLTIQPSMSWKLSPDWVLSTSYRYRYQERSGNEKAADSNSIILSINYHWQGLSIAR